ncbi:MAG: hypoxanthine phosphoribosyltransferase [Candidatus Poribacteria bacterium]
MAQFQKPPKYIEKILLNEETILQRVQELGRQITQDYQNKDILLICVLKGALVFFADLIRDINVHFDFDFVQVSSYGNGTQSSGNVIFLRKPVVNINDRDVLIVDDILDSGLTLSYLKSYLLSKKPSSLKICVLLNKVSRRIIPIEVDYIGFDIPDEFVVGYGLDFNGMYRGLRYIAVLRDEN